MDYYFYPYIALTGGADGALDSLDGSLLKDGDSAFVVIPATQRSYIYTLDADSAASESSPSVIAPDANAGDKRWVLTQNWSGSSSIDWVNVTDPTYGATGDGATDDLAAIKLAIDAVQTTGGTVYFPPGVYLISGSIDNLYSNVKLLGAGKGASIIRFDAAVTSGVKMLQNDDRTNGNARIVIQHLTLDGNHADTSQTGIDFFKCTFCEISHNRFMQFTQHCLDMTQNNSHNVIAFNEMDDYGTDAGASDTGFGVVILGGSNYNKVIGNSIRSTLDNVGIAIDNWSSGATSEACVENSVIGNFIYGMNQGIVIAGSNRNIIKGNTITGVDELGILCGEGEATAPPNLNSELNVISGNIINLSGASSDGMEIQGNLNTIVGNTINGGRYGIRLRTYTLGQDHNVISANVMQSQSTYGIWVETGGMPLMTDNRIRNVTAPIQIDISTYTDGDATPSVYGIKSMVVANNNATVITNFDSAEDDQEVTLTFTDNNTTINRDHCYLYGGNNFAATVWDSITLKYRYNAGNSYWYEKSRSVNS